MAASKQIDFETGTPVTADFLDRIQEIQSGLATNLALTLSSSTTVTLPAASGNGAVSLTIGDKFRYIESPIVVTFSGSDSSGSYGIWATTTSDDSVSSFSVEKVAGSGTPTATYSRQIGTVSWSGTALSSLVQAAGYSDHGYMHTLAGDPLPAGSVSASQIVDGTITLTELASSLQQLLVPTGSILSFGGSSAPSGFLLCDGSEHARATYAALDAVIGTTYGAYTDGAGASGSTHFRVPDLRGRAPLGSGQGVGTNDGSSGSQRVTGANGTSRSLGAWGGRETHQLTAGESGMPSHTVNADGGHTHTVGNDTPDHSHAIPGGGAIVQTYNAEQGANVSTGGNGYGLAGIGGATARHSHSVTGGSHTHTVTAVGASSAHNNVAPFVVVNFIIKV